MWSLWNNRNDHRHGKSPIEPGLAVDWAQEACLHWQSSSGRGKESTQQEVWRPPAVGAVVRCTAGRFRVASARWLRSVGSALLAGKRKRSGVAETDAQELVSLWQNRGIHRPEVATILQDVEEMAGGIHLF